MCLGQAEMISRVCFQQILHISYLSDEMVMFGMNNAQKLLMLQQRGQHETK